MISMTVQEPLTLKLAHAFDLYIGFVIIGLIVFLNMLDKFGVCRNNGTLHSAKIKSECGSLFFPISFYNFNRVFNHVF